VIQSLLFFSDLSGPPTVTRVYVLAVFQAYASPCPSFDLAHYLKDSPRKQTSPDLQHYPGDGPDDATGKAHRIDSRLIPRLVLYRVGDLVRTVLWKIQPTSLSRSLDRYRMISCLRQTNLENRCGCI